MERPIVVEVTYSYPWKERQFWGMVSGANELPLIGHMVKTPHGERRVQEILWQYDRGVILQCD